MSPNKISSDCAAFKNPQLNYMSSPLESAKKHTEEVEKEAIDNKKLTDDNNYYASIFRMLNSGWFDSSKLKKLQGIQGGNYSSVSGANEILYSQQQSYIKQIQEEAARQAEKLKDFDVGTRFEEINLKTSDGVVATKEDYDFAQEILAKLQQNGDNSISFNEVLAEVQSGKYAV